MAKLTPELKLKYRDYIKETEKAAENLDFLLDNLGYKVDLNYSVESLEEVEGIFWNMLNKGIPSDFSDDEHFAQLIGQYFGHCLIVKTGAKWVQCKDANPMLGQSCIDGFGNKSWDKMFPVEIALNIRNLPKTKPDYPGVKDKRVFAAAFDRALKIYYERDK